MLLFYKMGAVFSPFSKGLRAKHSYIENCRIVASRCQKLCLLFEKELNNLPFFDEDTDIIKKLGPALDKRLGSHSWNILMENISIMEKHLGLA